MAGPSGFQHLILLAFVAGCTSVADVVSMTHAYVEDVEFVLNELEAVGAIVAVHRPLGVYALK